MGVRERSQYQCMNCGALSWMGDPPDIDQDELYTELRCSHCKQTVKQLWVGTEPGEEYIYYDVTKDSRYY
jgi:DNA-directed RNA polymerase subunit RPC12/RpoP